MRQTPDLSDVPIFEHLDEDERAEFEELSEPVRFEAGQRIFEEGAPEERLYVITSGTVEVYKSSTCKCCAKWVDHMRANGFTVNTHDVGNKEARSEIAQIKVVVPNATLRVLDRAIQAFGARTPAWLPIPVRAVTRLLKEDA